MVFRNLLLLMLALVGGCQKKAALSPSGDPQSVLAPLPMGATVYNGELQKELTLLDDLLQNRIDLRRIEETVHALMAGRLNEKASVAMNETLASLFLTLPELIHGYKKLTPNEKLWCKAKLLFLRRRFIEASTVMTEILKHDPHFTEARNWRARAYFFLGNPDRAVSELQYIIKENPPTSPQSLESLYLIGAIIFESNDLDKHRLNTGIKAWQDYLHLAQSDEELSAEITTGLAELKNRQKGNEQTQVAVIADPFSPRESFSAHKNAALTAFMKDELLLALELCNKSLSQSYDRDVAIVKARIYIKTGRMDEAVDLFASITEKNAHYAPAFHFSGMAFMLKGQIENAIRSWKKTLELDPAYARSHRLDQRLAVAQNMLQPTPIETH